MIFKQFKWKKTYGIKIQTEIKFKVHVEGKQNNKNNERE